MKSPNNTVWLYWETPVGETKPPHIQFCHDLLRSQRHSVDVRIVTPKNINQYLPDLDPRVWDIHLSDSRQNPIAVRCAFIRAFLLERYGGLYVDSDCIALTDYVNIFEEVGKADFFAMRRTSGNKNHISIGFYGSRAGGKIIIDYCNKLREIISKKTEFSWGEVGAHLITPIVDENLDRCFIFREDRIQPIVAEEQHLLADTRTNISDVIPPDAITLMLFHRIFEQPVKGVTLKGWAPTDLASSNALISRVYRGRMGVPVLTDEKDSSYKEKAMSQNEVTSNQAVVVLGSGRSGTSLLMQVLRELGMSTGGGTLVPASGSNPEGFLEDAEIVEVHKTLLTELGTTPASPLPDSWLDTPATRTARKQLRQIIQQRVEQAGDKVWGFKDPRTTTFMPLWVKLFNQPGFKPRYLLAVRDPASVIASLREQVQRDDAINELLWLRRNIEALHNTAGNCFIVHYEDWFKRPDELVRGLLGYTGLDETFNGDVGEVVNRVVKAQLNRAPRQHQDVKVSNPCVTELYEVLRECHGADFDHTALMDRVERTRQVMRSFDAGTVRPKATIRNEHSVNSANNKNLDEIKEKHQKECAALQDENNRLLRELTVATKDLEILRTRLTAMQQAHGKLVDSDKVRTLSHKVSQLEKKLGAVRISSSTKIEKRDQRIKQLQNNLKSTRQSYAYKIGWTIVSAIKKPGMNTIKAPFRFLKLSFMFLRGRRST